MYNNSETKIRISKLRKSLSFVLYNTGVTTKLNNNKKRKMDLLDKLNIHSLPEQQTRLSYPNLENIFMLSKDSSNSTNDIRLGFNVCCVCAKELMVSEVVVVKKCQGCKRVNYCSSRCRTIDTNPEEGNAACSNRSTDGSSIP